MTADLQSAGPAFALGTAFYTNDDLDTCLELVNTFVDAGGSIIDTARHYGQSESVLGKWIASAGARDRIYLITKGGHGKNYGLEPDEFKPTVEAELAASMEKLNTGRIDLYMLHRDSVNVPVGQIIDCLNGLIDSGKVNSIGASNWSYERMEEANEYARAHGLAGFSAASNNISLAVPAEPFYPGLISVDSAGEAWHRKTGIPLISWSSQARGFFTDKFGAELFDAPDDRLEGFTLRMKQVYFTADNLERKRRASAIGREKGGYSATQAALAYLLHKPFPVIPIAGARNADEVRSCFESLKIQLTEAETGWLNLENDATSESGSPPK